MPSNSYVNFPFPLEGRFEDHGRRLELTYPFVYDDPEKGIKVVVPTGFETDFNSVPRGLWNILPPWEYPEAGVVHDYLYKFPEVFTGDSTRTLNRGECDDIHRRILDLTGASFFKRQAMWAGIRAGGWKPWGRYRSNSQ